MSKNDFYKFTILKELDPNQTYTLIYNSLNDQKSITENGQHLITDGNIVDLIYSYKEEYYKPMYDDTRIHFKSGSAVVEISEANYVIVQKVKDKEIDCAEIYTVVNDINYLDKLVSIASERYFDDSNVVKKQEPYVRKVLIKK